jgi:hypothetical protein
MQRRGAIVLFAVLMVPILLPLLAIQGKSSEAQLPICCRRDGKHHCGMMAEELPSDHSVIGSPMVCPYGSTVLTVAHNLSFYPPASATFYAGVNEHPAIHAQVTANLLVAESRSHQKRGPPAVTNS